MKLSLCLITAREQPHYEWLLDGLAAQSQTGDEIELVIVDFRARTIRELLPNYDQVSHQWDHFSVVIRPPKPNPWQGPHRVTSRDLHAIANARNTGICLASHDYMAFLDDRVKIGATWLSAIRRGSRTRLAAIAGPVDRSEHGAGRIRDDRSVRSPLARRGVPGEWLYGGNFAAPLEWILDVGGCEEGTDPAGRQDRILGLMLVNSGRRIDFDPELLATTDRRLPDRHPFPRIRQGVPPADKAKAIMDRFGKLAHTQMTPDLRAIRAALQCGEPFPMHSYSAQDADWFDGRPIGAM